jgi:monofunctional biosynthetic peptidoglycan transglycosylase
MASKRVKRAIFLSLGLLSGVISFVFWIYLSFDGEKLKTHYPHRTIGSGQTSVFVLKKTRPSNWVSLDQVSPGAKWAIILSEDWGFYQHEGVDLGQVMIALEDILMKRGFRGASTITQQLIKNVFLTQERSIWRKTREIILARKLEKSLSKARILESYLNVIEYGPGIYGIRKASSHYFGKHPSALTPKEGAFLAMLLPSPKRYYQSFQKKKLTSFAKARINEILSKMKMAKIITGAERDHWVQTPFIWEIP